MFSLLNVASINTSDIITIVCTVISIAIVLPSAVVFLVRSLNVKKFYNALFSALGMNDSGYGERYRLKHYVKHSFTLENFESTETLSYKKFIKKVKNTKIVLLTGSAGLGKSKLMQRLALKFRSRIQKDTKGRKVANYGILFYKLTRDKTVDDIINRIERDIGNSQISYSLFLDGLDEMPGLNRNTGDDILKELISKLLRDFSSNCSRIFISLRPEILSKGYSFAEAIPDENISIFKIRNFEYKQILAMYRNETRNDKTKLQVRKQNFKKLKQVIKNKPNESIFTYPLILTWADEIMSDCDIQELEHISWYDALGKVIDYELKRECKLYCTAHNIDYSDGLCKQFINDAVELLSDIALTMALYNTQIISRESVLANTIVKQFNEAHNETTGNTLLSRRLLRYVDWSEKSNNQPYFEFIHNTIYWRVLAGALINPDTPQEIRAGIILEQAENKNSTPLMQYCYQGLWSEQKGEKNVFSYADYFAYMWAIDAKTVECSTKNNALPLEVILSCFYGFDKVVFDQSVRFDTFRIKEFVKDRKLNLSKTVITDLSLVNSFSDNSFDALDCSSSNVVKADIPSYVKEIKFYRCSSLTEITIPDSVTSFGEYAFAMCNSLTEIKIPNGIRSIGKSVFGKCASLTNIVLPPSVERIEEYAFAECTSLTTITIPDRVTSIGGYAFLSCTSLANITLPDNVESIGDFTFNKCNALTDIKIPDRVTSIGENAFILCTSLINVTLSASLKSIGKQAFAGCSLLKNITLPANLKRIGEQAFAGCATLTEITIPDSVTNIENSAFLRCSSLERVKYSGTMQGWNNMEIIKTAFLYSKVVEVICKDGIVKLT